TVKHPRGPTMVSPFVPGHLDDAAFRREVSFQNNQPSSPLNRIGDRSDHVLARRLDSTAGFLSNCSPAGSHLRPIDESRFQELLGNQGDSAGTMDVHGKVPPTRLQISNNGCARADNVKVIDLKR